MHLIDFHDAHIAIPLNWFPGSLDNLSLHVIPF